MKVIAARADSGKEVSLVFAKVNNPKEYRT